MVARYTPTRVAEITGVSPDKLADLARKYACQKPASILFGYGMQRYRNSGQTIRAIDALAAITGNVGIPGGGANYAHGYHKFIFGDVAGEELAHSRRYFVMARLGEEILEANDPPVRAIFVTRSNPITQSPRTSKVVQAFRKVPFKVVVDLFMTDTVEEADLVLPCTTFLEDTDIIVNSAHFFVGLAQKVVEPVGESRPEHWIFAELARRLGLEGFGNHDTEGWLKFALDCGHKHAISLERLRAGVVPNPLAETVAWADRKFPTPSGKIEVYSRLAAADGLDSLPVFHKLDDGWLDDDNGAGAKGCGDASADTDANDALHAEASPGADTCDYPLYLITPHHRDFIHSQFWNLRHIGESPSVEIHPDVARKLGFAEGDRVTIQSPQGCLTGVAHLSERLHLAVVQVHQGRWLKQGGGVNLLTDDKVSDMGLGAAYYDCRCRVVSADGGE